MPVAKKHIRELMKKKYPDTMLLARWLSNKLYYAVSLKKFNPKNNEVLVEYEDKTEAWALKEDLHLQFCSSTCPYPSDDDIVCAICDGGNSDAPNEIILCDTCQQGYHQRCHEPNIEISEDEWSCVTCTYITGQTKAKAIINTSTPKKVAILDDTDNTMDEVSNDQNSESIEHLEQAVTREKMDSEVVNIAAALIGKDQGSRKCVKTKDFVAAISPEVPAISKPPSQDKQELVDPDNSVVGQTPDHSQESNDALAEEYEKSPVDEVKQTTSEATKKTNSRAVAIPKQAANPISKIPGKTIVKPEAKTKKLAARSTPLDEAVAKTIKMPKVVRKKMVAKPA